MIQRSLIFIVLLACVSFSFPKKKKFVPPGTVQITENLFADETEVSNLSWLEFEYWTKAKYGPNSKEHIATLPDTLVWRNSESFNEPYVIYYYRHPAYKEFPVVGISYDQALAFCKWRSDRVKEFYALAHKKELFLNYTLPTKEEWEFISMGGSYAFTNNGRDAKDRATLNCRRAKNDTLLIDKRANNGSSADVTTPVYSYYKNPFGLFNSFGNVAEMVLEKGICKGGGWIHPIQECRAGIDIPYSQPKSWLGFRCVCKLLKPTKG